MVRSGGRVSRGADRFESNFGAFIAEHWQENYPEFWERLGNTAAAFCDECAARAAEYFATAIAKGESADTAYVFAELAWKIPPDRTPNQTPRPYKAQKVSTR